MPPHKPVPNLQSLAAHCLSDQLALSVASLASGSYTFLKTQNKETNNQKCKNPKLSRPVLVIPSKETQKIKNYIGHNIPISARTTVFHEVLELVTHLLIRSNNLNGTTTTFTFAERITHLDNGFMYVFSILLDNEVTKLDFTKALHTTMKWIDTCRLNNRNPKDSNFSYTKIENVFLKHFAENSKSMETVVYLQWPHLISGELIRIIGRHFKGLKSLILACSCEMGPFIEEERKGVGKLGSQEDLILSLEALFSRTPGDFIPTVPSGCPKLRKLVLPNLDDERGKAAIILAEALMNLQHLEYVSGISTLSSLSFLHAKEGDCAKLSLKNISDYDPLKRRLLPEVSFLKGLLPRLESIELRVSKDLTRRVIVQFPDVLQLSIEWPDFHIYAKDFGSLSSLHISLDFQSPWPLLHALSRYCKSLQRLTLEHPTFQIDNHGMKDLRVPRLACLEYFKLIRSSFIEFTAFKTFITGCPGINELYITLTNDRNYMVDEFGDQLIRAIAPLLKNLKRFTAECLYKHNLYLHMNCILTIASVYNLISNCPALTFAGHLDSWDVNDREIKELNKIIQSKNWKLELA